MSEETQEPEEITEAAEAAEAAETREGKVGLSFLTIFILLLVGALIFMGFKGDEGEIGKFLIQDGLYNETFGNMHPLVLHLPIGIVFLTVVLEALGWISFGKYRPVTTVGLFLAIITGAFACVTGFVDMHADYNPESETWNDHMWMGIIFVGVLSLAFLSRVWSPKKGGRNPIYAILLIGAASVMGFGAHIGGEEIHGPTGVEKIVQQLTGKAETVTDIDDSDEEAPVVFKEPKDRLAYEDVIVPILESRCLMCHAEDTKKKGGLLMDSWDHLIAGGGSMPEIPTFVPGDVKASYMAEVLFLDEDDDMFMPPPSKKREPMPAHEREIIKWWIGAIPKGNELADKTLEDMEAPAEIIEAASQLVTPEELEAIKREKEAQEKAIADAKKKEREALDSALGALKQDEKLSNAVGYVSQDSSDLQFSAVSLRKSMTDDDLVKLSPVASSIRELVINATSISEDAMVAVLPKMVNLKKLNLSETAISDNGVDTITKLHELEYLNLFGTEVTDAGIIKLKTLTHLKKLFLWDSKATQVGVDALQKELPNLQINFPKK